MLYRTNSDGRWQKILGATEADLHMRDVEAILRGFSLLAFGDDYKPSMTRFLNASSRRFKKLDSNKVAYFESLFSAFLNACQTLPPRAFHGRGGAFTISIFDAVFAAVCKAAYAQQETDIPSIDAGRLQQLKEDPEFFEASQSRTVGTGNVKKRLAKAVEMLS